MNERTYLFLVGCYILLALYLGIDAMIYVLSLILLFEGITGIRLTRFIQNTRQVSLETGLFVSLTEARIAIDGLSAWRVFVAMMLVVSRVLTSASSNDLFWFFPWFMGFAILGAGVSGICPILMGLRRFGFK